VSDCVFCSRYDQAPPLFETPHLFAIPDKFPLTPGHTLIVSSAHLACYGAADDDVHYALDLAIAEVESFLSAAYGQPVLLWENGVSGQSVFHAHLHLIPVRVPTLPAAIAEDPDLVPLNAWSDLRERYARNGHYRLVGFGGRRYVLPGHGPILRDFTLFLAEGSGLEYGPTGWVRTVGPEQVADVATRWRAHRSLHQSPAQTSPP